MKKILSIFLALVMVVSLTLIAAPVAFADGPATDSLSSEKDPVTTTVQAGGQVVFMAYPKGDGAYTTYWTFLLGDGTVVEMENLANYFSGLVIEIPDGQRIRLKNIPESMSGVRVQAHFIGADGTTIHTGTAYLFVDPASCPQPIATNCQTNVESCTIVITKHPLDEVLLTDGQSSTYFTAHAENYSWISWQFKIGDSGTPFSAEEAVSQYGLNLEGLNSEKLWVRKLYKDRLNGWYVRAVFHDCNGGIKYSNWAIMLFATAKSSCTTPAPCPQQPPCSLPPCAEPPHGGCHEQPPCPPPSDPCSCDGEVTITITIEPSGGGGCP